MLAKDVLEDDVNELEVGGTMVRKGSVGAFLANVRLLASVEADATGRAAIMDDIRALIPALRAIGLFEVFEVRDQKLRAIVEAEL